MKSDQIQEKIKMECIEEEEEEEENLRDHEGASIEIIEDIEEESESLFSFDINNTNNLEEDGDGDWDDGRIEKVYVAVGKTDSSSSLNALGWMLKHAAIGSSTVVYLLHVFPQIRYIPTPCLYSSPFIFHFPLSIYASPYSKKIS